MVSKKRRNEWLMKKEWKIRYDEGWREIMSEVAEILQIPYEDIERINTAWWKFVSEMMARVEMPVIRMDYLCVLYPSKAKLYSYCERMGRWLNHVSTGRVREGVKIGDVGAMRKHLSKLHDTYFRLEEESKKPVKVGRRGAGRDLDELIERGAVPRADVVELRKLGEQKNEEE